MTLQPSTDATPARWWRTRPVDLVAETLSDETLVIDTVSGVFYSLRGVASALWTILGGTATSDELRAAVREQFTDAPTSDVDVDAFLAALEADDLIVGSDAPRSGAPTSPTSWPDPYAPPVLKRYDDMADLLLVDPIHDVATESGWPERRTDTP